MSDNTFDIRDDESLGILIHDAFDHVEPSSEAEDRMLAALLAAQADTGAKVEDGPASTQAAAAQVDATTKAANTSNAPEPPTRIIQMPTARKRRSASRILLPAAAVLVLVAVLVGVGFGAGLLGGSHIADLASNGAPVSATAPNAPGDAEGKTEAAPQESGANAAAASSARTESTAEESLLLYDSTADSLANGEGYWDEGIDFNTEEYAHLSEGRFVSTLTSPLSTLSADVDTASYCNVRRLINQRSGVPAGAVRIEEMLNYFTYDYTTPSGNGQFATTVQVAPCPWNADTQLLVLGFATAEEPTHAPAGTNLVFLIDISGSMNASDKLPLLQDSFAELTSQLDENDRVSIVTYASGESIVLEGASGTNAREIQRAIDSLRANGATNGEAGLKMAYEVAERNYIEGGVNRIIMASDGDLNVGITSESDLYDLVDSKRESGIYLSVLGFGTGNYKDTKMETLADHGNGNYHYIDCLDEAKRVFGEKLLANLVPFADDVKVQVEFNPSQIKAYRLIGYENRGLAAEDFRDDAVDAGDVGPNSQFTVAYEIVPVDSAFEIDDLELRYGTSESVASAATTASSTNGELLTATLRWHAFADGEVHEQATHVLASDVTDNPSADWKFAAAVIEFGMNLRGSQYVGTSSYQSAIDLANEALRDNDGFRADERTAFAQLVEKAMRAYE